MQADWGERHFGRCGPGRGSGQRRGATTRPRSIATLRRRPHLLARSSFWTATSAEGDFNAVRERDAHPWGASAPIQLARCVRPAFVRYGRGRAGLARFNPATNFGWGVLGGEPPGGSQTAKRFGRRESSAIATQLARGSRSTSRPAVNVGACCFVGRDVPDLDLSAVHDRGRRVLRAHISRTTSCTTRIPCPQPHRRLLPAHRRRPRAMDLRPRPTVASMGGHVARVPSPTCTSDHRATVQLNALRRPASASRGRARPRDGHFRRGGAPTRSQCDAVPAAVCTRDLLSDTTVWGYGGWT